MSRKMAILGSITDHGGVIITGSDDVRACDGTKVARCGDLHACPLPGHAVNAIVTCDPLAFANGEGIARVGDLTACGARIITGCETVFGSEEDE